MIEELIPTLRLAHGSFNLIIVLLFFYQGWQGFKIRRHRKKGGPPIFLPVKRHRRLGPILVLLGWVGYVAGWILVYYDHGLWLQYPAHAFTGTAIVLLALTTFVVSRRIKSLGSPWRTPHFLIGITILSLYLVQVFLGLNILL